NADVIATWLTATCPSATTWFKRVAMYALQGGKLFDCGAAKPRQEAGGPGAQHVAVAPVRGHGGGAVAVAEAELRGDLDEGGGLHDRQRHPVAVRIDRRDVGAVAVFQRHAGAVEHGHVGAPFILEPRDHGAADGQDHHFDPGVDGIVVHHEVRLDLSEGDEGR